MTEAFSEQPPQKGKNKSLRGSNEVKVEPKGIIGKENDSENPMMLLGPLEYEINPEAYLSFDEEDIVQVTSEMEQVFNFVNMERTRRGRPALCFNSKLNNAAQLHSGDMASKGYFSHTSLDGTTLGRRVTRAGYRYSNVGENIAIDSNTYGAHFQFRKSPSNLASMVDSVYRHIGIGIARYTTGENRGKLIFTQVFGYSTSESCSSTRLTYSRIRNKRISNMSIDLFQTSTTHRNRNPVVLGHSQKTAWNQKWILQSDGTIRSNIDPSKCLEAGKNPKLYAKAFVWDCHGGEWQKWTRYTSGRIRNNYHKFFLGLAYCGERATRDLWGDKNTRAVELRNYESGGNCGEAQKWVIS